MVVFMYVLRASWIEHNTVLISMSHGIEKKRVFSDKLERFKTDSEIIITVQNDPGFLIPGPYEEKLSNDEASMYQQD